MRTKLAGRLTSGSRPVLPAERFGLRSTLSRKAKLSLRHSPRSCIRPDSSYSTLYSSDNISRTRCRPSQSTVTSKLTLSLHRAKIAGAWTCWLAATASTPSGSCPTTTVATTSTTSRTTFVKVTAVAAAAGRGVDTCDTVQGQTCRNRHLGPQNCRLVRESVTLPPRVVLRRGFCRPGALTGHRTAARVTLPRSTGERAG